MLQAEKDKANSRVSGMVVKFREIQEKRKKLGEMLLKLDKDLKRLGKRYLGGGGGKTQERSEGQNRE